MVQFGVVLVMSGVIGALWRQYHKSHTMTSVLSSPVLERNNTPSTEIISAHPIVVFDDVGELNHYQKAAMYTLALSAASTWFYPPVRILCLPLLGYNAYHFCRTVHNSDKADQRSPMTLFESIGVAGSFLTGSTLPASLLLVFSFGSRKLLLNAGNISNNIGFSKPLNPRSARVWVLRDGAEIESSVEDLQTDDVMVLHAGDAVVLECKVIEGRASVRQFSLRKQMKTVPKQKDDNVYPFTRVASGSLLVKAV